ncbi:MAG: histidinol dehydrogenase [Candidatus Pelagibacterales bacterium]|jgi:histidinol dehydrogenase|nr:MAG: histidinol dehydrogenase [Pelagibacterales bacterium]
MIKFIDCKDKSYLSRVNKILSKRRNAENQDIKIVKKILNDVRKNELKALKKYEIRFSGNSEIRISNEKLKKSIKKLNPKVKKAIDFAYKRISNFHYRQKKDLKNIYYKDSFGNKLEYKNVPIDSVGFYVPGNLPSTLLMNTIPAKIAKVRRLVLATPKVNGKLNSAVLYAAKKVGIKEIYSMGGAQAIASLAYIQKVNKIVGPGNKFVAEAKKQLPNNLVGTESMYCGASEICVLADKYTDVNQIATSLVSQAEHDPDSQCILVTKQRSLIVKVKKEMNKILNSIPRKKIAISSLKKNGLAIKVYSDKQVIDVINELAPEHLELNVNNYKRYEKKIMNAGSICNGRFTPMSLSDYTVGTNHVLPTSGSAKFSSGLSLSEFVKKISIVTLSKLGVEKIGNPAITLSEFEELFAHTQSIKSRMRRN